jgi:hypothetical protein
MFSNRLQRILSSLWLEFWLPLPLLGVLFWLGGNAAIDYILSRPFTTANTLKLLADPPTQINLSPASLSVKVEIDKIRELTRVEITLLETTEKVKFELPITETSQIEMAIAEKLELSREEVRKLTSYALVKQK